MERADLDARGVGQERPEAARDALGQIGGGLAVERHDADPLGRHAAGQEDGEAGDHRRRLAATGRRDDLGRSIGERGGGALLGIEGRKDPLDRRLEAGGWRGDRACGIDGNHAAKDPRRRVRTGYRVLIGTTPIRRADRRTRILSLARTTPSVERVAIHVKSQARYAGSDDTVPYDRELIRSGGASTRDRRRQASTPPPRRQRRASRPRRPEDSVERSARWCFSC